jgi:hypothetical protein
MNSDKLLASTYVAKQVMAQHLITSRLKIVDLMAMANHKSICQLMLHNQAMDRFLQM